ncbi:cation transporter [Aquibium oceanicum]|uniref:cation transporter n=1 Tax=Aquibium oceanicum TaxID=1670800 RepID=UPI0009FA04E6|nr:cation transporter [Aquibium oceanicum]
MIESLGDNPVDRQRLTLWIVLLLNVAIAVGFFASGALGDSSALIANGLDNTSDSLVYGLSLFAMTRADKWKRSAANVSGGMLLLFAIGILIDAVRRYFSGSEPLGPLMISMALVAAVVNLACVWLLARIKNPDVNVRAANTFSINDFASNGGILIAGGLVWWLGSNWPDLVVGLGVAGIAIWGGIGILRDAHKEHHKAVHDDANRGRNKNRSRRHAKIERSANTRIDL